MSINQILLRIKDSTFFQFTVTIVILASSLLVGIKTYNFDTASITYLILNYLDFAITLFFLFEISIRFFSEEIKSNFFRNGWNIFDSLIVIASLIPSGAAESVMILRLLRLARLLRIISFFPELRYVIESLIISLKKSFYVLVLIFIIIYVYAVAGVIFFGEVEGGRFEDLGEGLITLFQIMTLSSWETVMLPMIEIYPLSWIYFISYVLISSVIVLNLFIAILVDVVSSKNEN